MCRARHPLCAAVLDLVPDEQRRSQGAARIPGGRLDPDVSRTDPHAAGAISHAIQRDAAGHAEVFLARRFFTCCAIRSTISSVTTWMERARSISRWPISDSACAAARRRFRELARWSWSGRRAYSKYFIFMPEGAVVLQIEQVDRKFVSRISARRTARGP